MKDNNKVDLFVGDMLVILDRIPSKRSECENGVRPCPYVNCRYHTYSDHLALQEKDYGAYPFDSKCSCALDVADSGEQTLDTVGRVLGTSRQRVLQIETKALNSIKKRSKLLRTYLNDLRSVEAALDDGNTSSKGKEVSE